ncbi:MAG: fimbrillin family protein [Muribaculaceae bacterium]
MMKLSRNIILASIAAVAASCSDDTLPGTNPDNGERTPLNVAVALSNGTPLSRAEGKTFATNDELVARIRQVEWNQATDPDFQSVTEKAADQSPRLVLFKVTSNDMTVVDDNTKQTSNLTASSYWTGSDWLSITGGKLYWDDFSTASDPLTADGRYLQSAWGFCYNGGTPTTALDQDNGTIGWTAAADFTPNGVLRNNDLLWSKAQKPLKYEHGTFEGNYHGTLVIPYTHAMSMITIEVVAADGFTTGNLGSTTATLQAMYASATFSAPNATVSSQAGSQTVKMLARAEGTNAESKPNKMFQALVIPGKQLTEGNLLAEIANVDGNNYKIPVTDDILAAWSEQLDGGNTLKSGVNYKLTVTVAKQAISVVAQITDWTTIEATGTGKINFNADVTSSGVANEATGSFDLYRGTSTIPEAEGALAYATTSTWTTDKWINNPQIYWKDGSTSYYFRALATYDGSSLSSINNSSTPEGENALTAAAQGKDLMWATTKAHSGTAADGSSYSYDAGAAIRPRTGDVPLQFEHAMSKITINLSTSTTGILLANQSLDQQARAVDFTGAKISISNLCTAGTIAIANGNITPTALSVEAPTSLQKNVTTEIKDKGSISEIVIPQSLLEKTIGGTDNCPIKLTITLDDGTTYSLLLKDCKVKGFADNYITTWERGTHYVYEIYVEKEVIRFVAVIKEWKEVNGGGNANLDWD